MPQDANTQFLRSKWFGLLLGLLTAGILVLLPYPVLFAGSDGLLAIAGAATVLLALFVHPLTCFALYFGTLFFSDTKLPGIPVTANQVMALIFIVSVISARVKGKTLKLESPFPLLLCVIAVYFSVSALTGEDFDRGIIHFRYAFLYPILAISLAWCLRTEKSILRLAWIVVILTFIAALAGLYQAFTNSYVGGAHLNRMRVQGTAKNPILFGWWMLFAYPFGFYLYSELRTIPTRLLGLILVIGSLSAAALTFNRQTYILIVIVVGLTSFLYRYANRATVLAAIGILGGGSVLAILPLILQRMFTVTELGRDPSFQERRDASLVAIEMFQQHPFFGIGLGSYPAVWKKYLPADFSTYGMQYQEANRLRFPDMGYMQLLSETGVIGLLLFLGLMSFVIWRAWVLRKDACRRKDNFAVNYCSLVLTLCAFVLASTAIQDTFLYVRLWILIALAILLDRRILGFNKPGESSPATVERTP